jgi:hypothetical protein
VLNQRIVSKEIWTKGGDMKIRTEIVPKEPSSIQKTLLDLVIHSSDKKKEHAGKKTTKEINTPVKKKGDKK